MTVIVPVYNGEKTIGACLGSLINQSYPKDRYEIIAVDNASKDMTARIVHAYPVKYVFEGSKQSSYAARNAGQRQARGEILAFTDADCIVSPDWIRDGIDGFAESGAEVLGVAGTIRGFEPESRVEAYLLERDPVKHSVKNRFLPFAVTANVFYKREVFDKIGPFEEWTSGGDADFSWRVQLGGYQMRFLPNAAVFHRHRSTVNGMFKQFLKFGYGNAQLSKKYRQRLGSGSQTGLTNPVTGRVKRRRRGPLHYDALASFGWKIGRVVGHFRPELSLRGAAAPGPA